MSKFPVALQLYSVRDEMWKDFEGTLRAVKAMGYDGVEFASKCGKTAAEIRTLCEEIGLVPLSAHIPFTEMMADPEGTMKFYAEAGCQYVVIPYLTEEYRPGAEKFQDVIDGARVLGKAAKEHGLVLQYHNHDFEFVKIDGEYALDRLYREVPADYLQTQLDTCWVNVGGEDPAAYLRKYTGRAPTVHLKDFVGGKSDNMYALIGIDDGENKKAEATKFELRSVGAGIQDFPAILKAAHEVGSKWIIVEQDMPHGGNTPLQCAQMSMDYLKTINQ